MVNVEKVYETLLNNEVNFFTGVPDSLLKNAPDFPERILLVSLREHFQFSWKEARTSQAFYIFLSVFFAALCAATQSVSRLKGVMYSGSEIND